MTRFASRLRLRFPPHVAGGALAVAAGLLIDRLPPPVLVNESSSLPRGLYVRRWSVDPDLGAVVAFPQPVEGRIHLARWGVPADVLLLKRVAAAGGDEICTGPRTLRVPGRTVALRARDRAGVALPRWAGCRRLKPDEVLVLGDTAASFDGRYFGPIRTEQLAGVYEEALTW